MRTANGDFASLQTAKNGATGAGWSNFFSRQVEKDFVRNDEGNEGVKLLIAGGGTGGHVFPAIAIAKEWLSRGGGREVVLVGTQRGLEMKLVPQAGLPLETLRVAGLKGKRGAMLLEKLAMLAPAMRDAGNVPPRHKPVAAFGVGGYAAGPRPVAGWPSGVPEGLLRTSAVRIAYARREFAAEVAPFLTNMPDRFAWADLIVCRAGATTAAEVAAAGRAAIFIPFAAATDSHQLRNAQEMARAGAGRVIPE